MSNALLHAVDIHKSYKDENGGEPLEVLQGINLEVQKSTITSIIGSSGSGKSTLLHILGGLDRPSKGNVLWQNRDLATMKADELADFRNKNMGFVFQFHHLLPEFTALENICMPALIAGTSLASASKRALELMDRFGVKERQHHRPTQLSGGEQQRVSMARALMNKPQLILADEPTGNLDANNTNLILDMLFELRDEEEVAILLITHEEAIANRSDVIYEIKNGAII